MIESSRRESSVERVAMAELPVSQTAIATSHAQTCQSRLREMARANISLTDDGIQLSVPTATGVATWPLKDSHAQRFSQLPIAFAQSYLQLHLRDFLYETFCVPAAVDTQLPTGNDRMGGGMHVGLLQQFEQANRGRAYFHPGWQVVSEDAASVLSDTVLSDNILVVENYGVRLHIERNRHLRVAERQAQVGDMVSVGMPCYRFESGAVIAIGEAGFVPEAVQALDIFLAVRHEQMPAVMNWVTSVLNGQQAGMRSVPFSLKVPYRPEDYGGPEAMVLRVDAADFPDVLSAIRQHRSGEGCLLEKLCDRQIPWPVFACPLCLGISVASAIHSRASFWYGSSADLSRTERVANALVQVWYDHGQQMPKGEVGLGAIASQITSQWNAAGLDPERPAWPNAMPGPIAQDGARNSGKERISG